MPENEALSRMFIEKDHVQTKEQEKVFHEKPNFTLKKLYTSNSNTKVFVPPPPQDLSNKATFSDSSKFSRGVCSTGGGQGALWNVLGHSEKNQILLWENLWPSGHRPCGVVYMDLLSRAMEASLENKHNLIPQLLHTRIQPKRRRSCAMIISSAC